MHLQPKESGYIREENLTRKHFDPQLSDTQHWKPSRKMAAHRADGEFDER